MSEVRVILVSPEEAYNDNAELWSGGEMMAFTVLHDCRLHLRIDPRRDGRPWLVDVGSLANALNDAAQRIAAY
jgi:hypothetical protein